VTWVTFTIRLPSLTRPSLVGASVVESSTIEEGPAMALAAAQLDEITRDRERIKQEFLRPEADRPATRARGNHHTALLSSDVRGTIRFFQDLLEFPLTEILENRDYPGSDHFFFDIGAGNLLAYFTLPGLDLQEYREVLGSLHHIAISVTQENWDYLRAKLDDADVSYLLESERSIYFSGPDGERLELLADPLGEMYGTKVL
jgi:catechol 2,3-dioxygenase-like lactoylglutathione lyase family enzyme